MVFQGIAEHWGQDSKCILMRLFFGSGLLDTGVSALSSKVVPA